MSILEFSSLEIEYHDFSRLHTNEKENALSNYVSNDANHVFDLVKGPLFKVGLVKINTTTHHLIITAHHIICDGWSFGIILEDLGTLYSAFRKNEIPNFVDLLKKFMFFPNFFELFQFFFSTSTCKYL